MPPERQGLGLGLGFEDFEKTNALCLPSTVLRVKYLVAIGGVLSLTNRVRVSRIQPYTRQSQLGYLCFGTQGQD